MNVNGARPRRTPSEVETEKKQMATGVFVRAVFDKLRETVFSSNLATLTKSKCHVFEALFGWVFNRNLNLLPTMQFPQHNLRVPRGSDNHVGIGGRSGEVVPRSTSIARVWSGEDRWANAVLYMHFNQSIDQLINQLQAFRRGCANWHCAS